MRYCIPRELLPYDPSDKESIVRYANLLVGKTLRQIGDPNLTCSEKGNKGRLGQALEFNYFKYEPNSDQEPDFPESGLELKTNPIKRLQDGRISAKERLVITIIDYCSLVNETWETSTVRKKLDDVLLVAYLHDSDADILDYEFKYAGILNMPDEDIEVVKNDWETIVGKVKSGRAHELSGSDTNYLEACTKGANAKTVRIQPFSDTPAKQRAFALKASYMTSFYRCHVSLDSIPRMEDEKDVGFEEIVRNRFKKYVDMSAESLAEEFGITSNAKNFNALLTKAILGIRGDRGIAEFVKAGIIVKTIRVESDGCVREHMSFPSFEFEELISEESWGDSAFGSICENSRFLFVVFKKQAQAYVLKGCSFWGMPFEDCEKAHATWSEARRVIREGVQLNDVSKRESSHRYKNNLPGPSFNHVAHVRPHARASAYRFADGTEVGNVDRDASNLPDGRAMTRQCFWIDGGYIAKQLHMLGY
ncbi:MAG: Sau3AI family type II restriction endonuclease [Slackia sp.]